MKILMIGGAGMIGSGLSKRFIDCGEDVLVLDNFLCSSKKNIQVENVILPETITSNACSFSSLNSVFTYFNPEIIFHFADCVVDKEGRYDFSLESTTCVNSTINLIKCINLHTCVKHVFFGSSCEVYANKGNKPIPESYKTSEVSYTGMSKGYAENMFRLASETGNFGFTSIRYFQIFGPRKFINPKHDISSFFIDSLLSNQGIAIIGPNKLVDVLSVVDAVNATYILYDAIVSGKKIDIVNVGSGKGIKLLDVYNTISEKVLGGIEKPLKFPAKKRVRSLVADVSLLKSLGWEPTISFEDSVLDILEEMKS